MPATLIVKQKAQHSQSGIFLLVSLLRSLPKRNTALLSHVRSTQTWHFTFSPLFYRVVFSTVPPNFQYRNEKKSSNPRAAFSRTIQCKTTPRWLNKFFFHFGTEKWEEQLKTLPKALRTQALTALTSNFGVVGLVQYAW